VNTLLSNLKLSPKQVSCDLLLLLLLFIILWKKHY